MCVFLVLPVKQFSIQCTISALLFGFLNLPPSDIEGGNGQFSRAKNDSTSVSRFWEAMNILQKRLESLRSIFVFDLTFTGWSIEDLNIISANDVMNRLLSSV